MSLDGKVANVTGGSQGIGRATADGLTEAGAEVVVADLNPPDGGIRADVSGARSRRSSGRTACSSTASRPGSR